MDGILPLWKEAGMTSHDCVFKLRKILKTKKIGHGGTLDPGVSGVLPICIGKGTKVIEYMVDSGKTYEGEITLGFSTTTEDAFGEIVEKKCLDRPFTNEEIDQAMDSFHGVITQVPPMYSAVKVNGKRLYEYARNGEVVERPKRQVRIDSFIRQNDSIFHAEEGTQTWKFQVCCGKGTYIRTLAVDTGCLLGVPAHMSELVRNTSGGLDKNQCFTLDQVKEKMLAHQIGDILLPIESAIEHFQRIDLSANTYKKVKNGAILSMAEISLTQMSTDLIALYYQNQVVSLYMSHPTKVNCLKPSKVLRNN